MASQVKVVVRVRPLLPNENGHSTKLLKVVDGGVLLQSHRPEDTLARQFPFHGIFDGTAEQADLANTLLPDLLDAVMEGYHATFMAYGQTGSGKSYTMDGNEYEYRASSVRAGAVRLRDVPRIAARQGSCDAEKLGITPRAVKAIFDRIEAAETDPSAGPESRPFTVRCSFLQIYNEQILDLLSPNAGAIITAAQQQVSGSKAQVFRGGLKLRWSQESEFYVEELLCPECRSAEEALAYYRQGVACKVMAGHNANAASSRSHCLFTIYVEQPRRGGGGEEGGGGGEKDGVITSRLTLVDLAGSERVAQTGASGRTLLESIGINKSLFTLRQVIQSLAEPTGQAPPYREAKLTSLLKHSLGGNSHTVMIACLSPSDAHVAENLNTLTYASKAQSIVNTPVVNLDCRSQMLESLRAENAQLKAELMHTQAALLALQSVATADKDWPEGGAAPKPLAQKPVPVEAAPASTKAGKKDETEGAELMRVLLQGEQALRDHQTQLEGDLRGARAENETLGEENRELRERLEVLEYLVATAGESGGLGEPQVPLTFVAGLASTPRETVAESGPADKEEEEVSPERAAAMKHQIATLQYHLHLLEQTVQQLRQEAVTASGAAAGPTGRQQGKATGRANVRSEGRKRATPPAPRQAPRAASGTLPARGSAVSHERSQFGGSGHEASAVGEGKKGNLGKGGKHAGALSLTDLCSLLKAKGAAGNGKGPARRKRSQAAATAPPAGPAMAPSFLSAFARDGEQTRPLNEAFVDVVAAGFVPAEGGEGMKPPAESMYDLPSGGVEGMMLDELMCGGRGGREAGERLEPETLPALM